MRAMTWLGKNDAPLSTKDERLARFKCRKCGGQMKASKAIEQTHTSGFGFRIGNRIATVSPGGPGKLVDCLKCEKCGHSVTP